MAQYPYIYKDADGAIRNLTQLSAAPSSPVAGQVYLDDGTNTSHGNPGLRRYTGTAWVDLGGTVYPAQENTDISIGTEVIAEIAVSESCVVSFLVSVWNETDATHRAGIVVVRMTKLSDGYGGYTYDVDLGVGPCAPDYGTEGTTFSAAYVSGTGMLQLKATVDADYAWAKAIPIAVVEHTS